MTLDIDVTGSGPTDRRVALRGRLDSLTAPKLDTELAPLLEAQDVKSLVFHLERLEYISSAGIRCVMRARKALEGRGGRVAIVNAQPAVLKVFEIVKALPSEQVERDPEDQEPAETKAQRDQQFAEKISVEETHPQAEL